MPYEIETRDGIILKNIPDELPADAPQLRALVAEERNARRNRKMNEAIQAPVDTAEAGRMATEGMGPVDKTLANIGAGYSSTGQGARKLLSKVGLAKPVPDEEVLQKRARDEALAKSTETGIGPDWLPSAGSALQVAGEVAPTLAIPAGPAVGMAGRVLPRALQAAVATPLRAGLTGGAIAGALQPTTENESVTMNTLLGAAGGAALPLAMQGYGAVRSLTRRGGEARAAERLGREVERLRPEVPGQAAREQAVADIGTSRVRGAEDIPLSTAATLESPELAMSERASRARNPAEWARADEARQGAVWQNITRGTGNADDVGALARARSEGWTEAQGRAMANVRPRVWNRELAQFRQNIEQASRSPQGQNEMRPILAEISRQLDDLGQEFTPEHLAWLRARMSGAVKGAPDDPFRSAPKTDPAFISLREEMDAILNASTGGRWQAAPTGYREASVPLSQARSSEALREGFVTPEGTPRTNVTAQGEPIVTPARLRQTMAAIERKNRYPSPTWAPDTEEALRGTEEALRRTDIVQRAKTAGTGGGASNTLMDAIARFHQLNPLSATNTAARALNLLRNLASGQEADAIDRALINPKEFARILQANIRAGQPLSPIETKVLQAMTTGAGGAASALPRALSAQERTP